MTRTADVVVAGAGHNSLITAAYLAKAGYEVVVVDARSLPGGGAVTEEPMLPGYKIDTCSTGHTLIRANPLITDDEIGLIADHGLEYVDPDPVAHIVFPDGAQFTMWLDLEQTCAEIEKFSRADAAAYRRLLCDWDEVRALFMQRRFLPVGVGPSLDAALAEHPKGRIWQRRLMMSAWDIIRTEFEHRHVRSFMIWMASQTGVDMFQLGTGELAYSLVAGRQKNSWSIPIGGSGQLVSALMQFLTSRGVEVLCNRRVSELILDDGRCVGVQTTEGDRFLARKAVVSTIHVKHLIDMAPAESWPAEFHFGVKSYDIGQPAMGMYLLTSAPPVFPTPGGDRFAVSGGYVGWAEDALDMQWAIRRGRWQTDPQWILMATPTLVDPTRAPTGHHTVKLLGPQAYEPPAGISREQARDDYANTQLELMRRYVPNLADEFILDRMVKGPWDYENENPHMIHGAFHGGDRGLAQSGANRPVPGWGQHRMPIPGLYQTGGTTHPGGSITGVPGRNAARVLLEDFGHNPADILSAVAAART